LAVVLYAPKGVVGTLLRNTVKGSGR
jgi:hypothetical protein